MERRPPGARDRISAVVPSEDGGRSAVADIDVESLPQMPLDGLQVPPKRRFHKLLRDRPGHRRWSGTTAPSGLRLFCGGRLTHADNPPVRQRPHGPFGEVQAVNAKGPATAVSSEREGPVMAALRVRDVDLLDRDPRRDLLEERIAERRVGEVDPLQPTEDRERFREPGRVGVTNRPGNAGEVEGHEIRAVK